MMNADQLRQLIDECEKTKRDLDKIDLNIAGAYAARCKKDKEALLELMKQGAWLTAQEALDWGFVDEVTDLPEDEKPRITEDVKNFMAAEGIPMPAVLLHEDDEEQNFLRRLMSALSNVFKSKNETKILDAMKKTYVNVCRTLKCEHLESEDGRIVVTEEQVQVIEDHMATDGEQIATLHSTVADRDKEITDLRAQLKAKEQAIADIRKKPADDSAQVIDNGKESNVTGDDYFAALADANELLNKLN